MDFKFPLLDIPQVWHVGTLNKHDKGCRFSVSYEGAGLSVSLHPDAWEAIAKLGGQPWWMLTRADGRAGRFIDVYALRGRLRAQLIAHAAEQELLAMQTRYEVSYLDLDTEFRNRPLFATPEEARAARAEIRASGVQALRSRKIEVPCATAKLQDALGQTVADGSAFEMAVTVLAEDLADIDGVWWASPLDVPAYSAPAGALSLRALPQWTSAPVQRFATC